MTRKIDIKMFQLRNVSFLYIFICLIVYDGKWQMENKNWKIEDEKCENDGRNDYTYYDDTGADLVKKLEISTRFVWNSFVN